MSNTKIVEIQRELGIHDAEIGIYHQDDGTVCLTVAQIEGADKDSTAAKIARALVAMAVSTPIDNPYVPGADVQLTSNPTNTIH
jgi:hypothetical protein